MMHEHAHDSSSSAVQAEAGEASNASDQPLSDGARWLAAISYLFVACLFVLYEVKQRPRGEFVRFHARQGFALFFVEVVLIVLSFIFGGTLGGIPVLGAIVMILFRLAAGLLAVGLSVYGFIEALGGQKWPLPLLGEYAKRVPLS